MHIPEQMLGGAVCPVSAVVGVAGVAAAVVFAVRAKEKPMPLRFAAVTALIFALQMVNFPVQSGTSGHFLGTVMAVMLLGAPFGILSMVAVLTVQSLVFADGGVLALGANVLNMSFVGALPAVLLCHLWRAKSPAGMTRRVSVFMASWSSVVLASISCSLLLGAGSSVRFYDAMVAMVDVHSLIAIGEGVITVLVLEAVSAFASRWSERFSLVASALFAGVVASVLSPFASAFPDGLEWVAGKYGISSAGAHYFVSPLSGYSVPFVADPLLSTAVAGAIGVVITFAAVLTFGALLVGARPGNTQHG